MLSQSHRIVEKFLMEQKEDYGTSPPLPVSISDSCQLAGLNRQGSNRPGKRQFDVRQGGGSEGPKPSLSLSLQFLLLFLLP